MGKHDPADLPAPPKYLGANQGGAFKPVEFAASIAVVNALGTSANGTVQPKHTVARNECHEGETGRSPTFAGFSTEKIVSYLYPVNSFGNPSRFQKCSPGYCKGFPKSEKYPDLRVPLV